MIPDSLPPIAFVMLAGLMLTIISVSHTSRYLSGQSHKTAHATPKFTEPSGWQIAIDEKGRVTYLKDYRQSYGTTRPRYRRVK